MHDENLRFDILLSGTYWGKKPQYSIWLNDHAVIQSELAHETQQVRFEHTLDAGSHTLKIRLENKVHSDTVIENNEIVKDMLLNIDDITINNISLGPLLWLAEYILDHPQQYNGTTIDHLDGCVNLGWNGTYIFKFSSPLHSWLLEKL